MIGWLIRRFTRNAEDPTWQATGFTYTTPLTHDESLASKAVKRAKGQSPTGRKLPKPKAQRDNVVRMPKRKVS